MLRGREGRLLENENSFLFLLETTQVRTLLLLPLIVDASGARTTKEAQESPGMSVCGNGDVTPKPLAAITRPRLAAYTHRHPLLRPLFCVLFIFPPRVCITPVTSQHPLLTACGWAARCHRVGPGMDLPAVQPATGHVPYPDDRTGA